MREALHWRTDSAGRRYRTVRTSPSGHPRGTVVLAGPGSVTTLGDTERDDLLLDRLADRLVLAGQQVLRCDMPPLTPGRPEDEADEEARTDRLDGMLRGVAHLPLGPVRLIGFALGARSLLRLLESGRLPDPETAVLVGLVLERDRFLEARVDRVHLVYGQRDLVAYAPAHLRPGLTDTVDGLAAQTLSPDVYGPWSARRLITGREGAVDVRILRGLGHMLHPCVHGALPDPVTALARLVTGTAATRVTHQ